MFFSDEYVSETEKIDRIYKMLRAQRRAKLFWLFIKLFLIAAIVYGAYYLSLPANVATKEKISNAVQAKLTEFIMPMVGSMVQDLTQNMLSPGQTPVSGKRKNTPTSTVLPANISPEMIKAVQDAMQKK